MIIICLVLWHPDLKNGKLVNVLHESLLTLRFYKKRFTVHDASSTRTAYLLWILIAGSIFILGLIVIRIGKDHYKYHFTWFMFFDEYVPQLSCFIFVITYTVFVIMVEISWIESSSNMVYTFANMVLHWRLLTDYMDRYLIISKKSDELFSENEQKLINRRIVNVIKRHQLIKR